MVCPCGLAAGRYSSAADIVIGPRRREFTSCAAAFACAAEFGEDFVFLENHVFLVVHLDFVSAVLSEQDAIAHFYVERNAVALFVTCRRRRRPLRLLGVFLLPCRG